MCSNPGQHFFPVTLEVKTVVDGTVHHHRQINGVIRGGPHQAIHGAEDVTVERIDTNSRIFFSPGWPVQPVGTTYPGQRGNQLTGPVIGYLAQYSASVDGHAGRGQKTGQILIIYVSLR